MRFRSLARQPTAVLALASLLVAQLLLPLAHAASARALQQGLSGCAAGQQAAGSGGEAIAAAVERVAAPHGALHDCARCLFCQGGAPAGPLPSSRSFQDGPPACEPGVLPPLATGPAARGVDLSAAAPRAPPRPSWR